MGNHDPRGAVAYNASFFSFPDGPETLINAGSAAILPTSGWLKDQATIDLCAQRRIPLYMIPD